MVGGTAQVRYSYGHDLISQSRAGVTSFYHYDGLGSTRALSNASGSLTDTYDYEAFGEVLGQTGTTENSYLFAGEQFDSSLNQYYLRARYYDQGTGRFTQMDTWAGRNFDPITLHKYVYANADPVTYVDPTGNFGIGGFGVSLNIQGVLATANVVSTGYSLFQLATGEEELTARQVGSAILFNMLGGAGGKVVGLFGKKFSKKFDELGCSRNSFVNGTLVHTSDGLVAIEDIRIGDQVWASNPETGELELRDVTHLIIGEQEYSLVDIKFESGENLTSTLEHPFYSGGKWIEAGELQVGNFVSTVGGLESTVVEVTLLDRSTMVYNLTVDGLHTYHVGEAGYLVHNTNIICDANVTAFFPKLNFGGLVQNRRLGDLTHNEIYNAFVRSAYKPSSHAIMRLREKRTRDLGFNTLNDVARIFNRGKKS